MAKAEKKETEVLSREDRQALCEKEVGAVLDKYNFRFSVELVYAKQGIAPALMFVDTTVSEEKKDEAEETKK